MHRQTGMADGAVLRRRNLRTMHAVPRRNLVDGTGFAQDRAREREDVGSENDSGHVLEHEGRNNLRFKRCLRDAG